MAFGVKTGNMFELLGDGDSEDVPSQPIVKPQAETKKAAPVVSGAANVEARMKGGPTSNGPVNGGRGRGSGGRGRGGRGGRGGYESNYREEGQGQGQGQGQGYQGGGEEIERGGRGFRGRGGGRHFERDRRRGYDRHDNSGRGHETEKRGGGGGHNWGAVGEENPIAAEEVVAEEEKITEVAEAEAEGEAGTEAKVDGATEPAEAAEPQEPEKPEMTLEEYEKTLADKRSKLNKKPVNEVKVDTKAFEGMKVYKPKEGEDNDLELSEKKQLGKNKAGLNEKARKEKELLPTGFRVGGDEGGRGRGRGDRGGRDRPDREFRERPRRSDENGPGRGFGRGYGRGDRPYSGGRGRGDGAIPSMVDKEAFPDLVQDSK